MDEFLERVQAVNEITTYDLVLIKSAVEVVYNEAFQCGRCVLKVDESFREKRKGCTGKFPINRPLMSGLVYTKCPGNFFVSSYAQLMDVHRMFRKGVLANAGGLLDQPAKYIDVMNFLEALISEKETEALKKSVKNGQQSSISRNHPRGKGRA